MGQTNSSGRPTGKLSMTQSPTWPAGIAEEDEDTMAVSEGSPVTSDTELCAVTPTESASSNSTQTSTPQRSATRSSLLSRQRFSIFGQGKTAELAAGQRSPWQVMNTYKLNMNAKKKKLVTYSWQQLLQRKVELRTIGLEIFCRIFELAPELKRVFRLSTTVSSVGDVGRDDNFTRHVRNFASLIDLLVKNLEHVDTEVAPVLVLYGRRHYRRKSIGFNNAYLDIFRTAAVEYFDDEMRQHFEQETPKRSADFDDPLDVCKKCWRRVISYMITKMTEGYHLEASEDKGNTGQKFASDI